MSRGTGQREAAGEEGHASLLTILWSLFCIGLWSVPRTPGCAVWTDTHQALSKRCAGLWGEGFRHTAGGARVWTHPRARGLDWSSVRWAP